MTLPIYKKDQQQEMHQGAIYEFRPIFWLNPPLWILRNHNWSPPPRFANIYLENEIPNAFRELSEEEDVIAKAKVRPAVILSSDKEIQSQIFKEVLIAPIYSLPDNKPEFTENLKNNKFPSLFYIPPPQQTDKLNEGYINLRGIRGLNKEFLDRGKLDISFSDQTVKAILHKYQRYLVTS